MEDLKNEKSTKFNFSCKFYNDELFWLFQGEQRNNGKRFVSYPGN
jgi:hypothetical protein